MNLVGFNFEEVLRNRDERALSVSFETMRDILGFRARRKGCVALTWVVTFRYVCFVGT